MAEHTLRGKVAVIGIGETTYYKHSQSPDPEFVLALKAILTACEDAGISFGGVVVGRKDDLVMNGGSGDGLGLIEDLCG